MRDFHARMVGHFLGLGGPAVEAAMDRAGGSLIGAIELLNTGRHARLRPLQPILMGPLGRIISAYHLGDPLTPADSFKPLLRRRLLEGVRNALTRAGKASQEGKVDEEWKVI